MMFDMLFCEFFCGCEGAYEQDEKSDSCWVCVHHVSIAVVPEKVPRIVIERVKSLNQQISYFR